MAEAAQADLCQQPEQKIHEGCADSHGRTAPGVSTERHRSLHGSHTPHGRIGVLGAD